MELRLNKTEVKTRAKQGEGLGALAVKLNLDRNYFYVMRCSCLPKYEYIQSLNNDFEKGFHKYVKDMELLKLKLCDMYFKLEDNKLISTFGAFLTVKEITKNPNSFGSSSSGVLFNTREGFSAHSVFLRYEAILDAYTEFEKTKPVLLSD